jgi:hypothetical protein
MISTVSKIQVDIDEHAYHFLCDPNCSLVEVHEALGKMMTLVIQQMSKASNQEPEVHDG